MKTSMEIRKDCAFVACATRDGCCEVLDFADDIKQIQNILDWRRHLKLSTVEVVLFWNWRSNEHDAGWLVIHDESEVLRWFDKFMEEFGQDDDWFEKNMKKPEEKKVVKQLGMHKPEDCQYAKWGECPICHTRYYIEDGVMKRSFVDPDKFGEHKYKERGTSDCEFGCKCWAGPSRSGGPVDPFGPCPNNPRTNTGGRT